MGNALEFLPGRLVQPPPAYGVPRVVQCTTYTTVHGSPDPHPALGVLWDLWDLDMLSICPPPHLGPQLLSLLGLLHLSLSLTKNEKKAFHRSLLERAGIGSQDKEKSGCELVLSLWGKPRN